MDNSRKLFFGATKTMAVLFLVVVMSFTQSITVEARRTSNYLELATGITNIISPIAPLTAKLLRLRLPRTQRSLQHPRAAQRVLQRANHQIS